MKKTILMLLAAIMTLAACNKEEEPAKPDPSATAEEFATVLTSSLNTVVNNINPEDHRMIFRALGDFSKKIEQSIDTILELIGKSTKASNGTVIDVNELLTNYKYKFTYSYLLKTFKPGLFKQDKVQFVWDLEKSGGDDCDLSLTAGGSSRSFTFRDTTYIVPTQVYMPLTVSGKSQMTLNLKNTYSEGKSDALTVNAELNGGYVLAYNGTLNPTTGNCETSFTKAGQKLTNANVSITGQDMMNILPSLLAEKDPEEVLQSVKTADYVITADKMSFVGQVQFCQLIKDMKGAGTPAQQAEALNKNVTLTCKTAEKEYCDIKACVDEKTEVLSVVMKFKDGTECSFNEFITKYPSVLAPFASLAEKAAAYMKMLEDYFDIEI